MAITRRRLHGTASQRVLLAFGLLLFPWITHARHDIPGSFPLRNQNPFLQVFGLPPFQSATLAQEDAPRYELSLDIANHADDGDTPDERFEIDGETYFLNFSLRRRVSDRLELGVDLPLVAHADGFLDNPIENWHDVFGMSNTKRRGPSNQLNFAYAGSGGVGYELASPSFGIGDIQLTAAFPIKEASDTGRKTDITLRASIKLPTGDAGTLLGSGATDLSVGAYVAGHGTLWSRDLDISGFVGALILGDGDVLAEIQRDVVPFGGISAAWHATDNFAFAAQLSAQGAYFDSALKALGGDSLQLAVGGYYRLPDASSSLGFAVVEDVSANATTDFALHFSLHLNGGP